MEGFKINRDCDTASGLLRIEVWGPESKEEINRFLSSIACTAVLVKCCAFGRGREGACESVLHVVDVAGDVAGDHDDDPSKSTSLRNDIL